MSTDPARSQVVEINSEQAFTPDPMYKLMAIFEDSEAGVSAVEDLKANGFEDKDIELFCGVRGEETFDFSGKDHGLGTRFMRLFRNITYDRVIMDRYQNALREGHCVLTLHIHKDVKKTDAAAIVHRFGAAQVDYFGLSMTQSFSPDGEWRNYDPEATF